MPFYEFVCPTCGIFEKMMPMSDSDVKELECDCGDVAKKIPSVSSFELKGGGWFAGGYTKGD